MSVLFYRFGAPNGYLKLFGSILTHQGKIYLSNKILDMAAPIQKYFLNAKFARFSKNFKIKICKKKRLKHQSIHKLQQY